MGDPHVKPSNIEESQRLIDWLSGLVVDLPLIFLGDQLDTFGVARVEVVDFWRKALHQLTKARAEKIFFIVGNHDQNHAGTHNFMSVFANFSDQVVVVEEPTTYENCRLIPFMRDNKDFVKAVNDSGSQTIFCHQEFDGAQFENGFYSPHGVKLDELTNTGLIISGHIHKTQHLGDKVFYPGTPRPLTKSDANEQKGVWVAAIEDRDFEFIPTPKEVAKSFRSITINSETDLKVVKKELKDPERLYVNIQGSSDFIKGVTKKLDLSEVKITVDYADELPETGTIKESEGVNKAFHKFAISYFDSSQDIGGTEIKAIMKVVSKYCPNLTTT